MCCLISVGYNLEWYVGKNKLANNIIIDQVSRFFLSKSWCMYHIDYCNQCVLLIPETCTVFWSFKISGGCFFLLSDIKFMNTLSFTKHLEKISVYSKVFVEW